MEGMGWDLRRSEACCTVARTDEAGVGRTKYQSVVQQRPATCTLSGGRLCRPLPVPLRSRVFVQSFQSSDQSSGLSASLRRRYKRSGVACFSCCLVCAEHVLQFQGLGLLYLTASELLRHGNCMLE